MIWTVWPLLVAIAACVAWSRFSGASGDEERWAWKIDGPLALGCAVAYALTAACALSKYYVLGGDYGDVDFAAYCGGLGALRDGALDGWYAKHSALGGFLLVEPARLVGVLGAVTGGAIVATGGGALGMFLWARIAAGRVAGVVALLFALANEQLLWLARSPSFYPETSAACMIGTAGLVAALRWRTLPSILAGGLGVGLILTADVRYFTVGVWSTVVLMVPVAVGPLKRFPHRAAVAILPLVAWWWVAHALHNAVLPTQHGPGAILQVATFLSDIRDYPQTAIPWKQMNQLDFLWGVDPVWYVPRTMMWLSQMSRVIPADWAQTYDLRVARAAFLEPWELIFGVGAVAGLVGLRKHPWALIAAFGPAVPFLANLALVFRTIAQPRFIAMGMVAVPVLIGVGVGSLGGVRWRRWPAAVLLTLLAVAVRGYLPSYLSPVAAWRLPAIATNRVYDVMQRAKGEPGVAALAREGVGDDVKQCAATVTADVEAGRVWMPFSDAPPETPPQFNVPPAIQAIKPDQ